MQARKVVFYYWKLAAIAAAAAIGISSLAQASPGREIIGASASIRIVDQRHFDLNGITAIRPPVKIVAGLLVYDRLESDYSRGDATVKTDDTLDDDSVKTDRSLNDAAVKTDGSLDDDTRDDALDDDSVKTDDSPDDDAVKTDDSLDDDSLEAE